MILNTVTRDSFLQCISYLAAAALCSAALVAFIPGKSYAYITPLGRRTLGIYLFHFGIMQILFHLSKSVGALPFWNPIAQNVLYLAIICAACFLASRAVLMTCFNKAAQGIETLLFGNPVIVTKEFAI
jgi:fucose 4-O-acetylase-like acetyltransferase